MTLSRGNLGFTMALVLCQAWFTFHGNSAAAAGPGQSTESAARASWRPVRGAAAPDLATGSATPASNAARVSVVRQASAQEEIMPAPIVDAGAVPMDGQIVVHEGHHEIVMGDPAMVSGGCGCGDAGCDGLACDSMGCNSCGPAGCGELIGNNTWRPCLTLCLPQDGWFSAEYLGWYQDGMSLPPLVSSNTTTVTRPQAGVIGSPGYTTLFGDDEILDSEIEGVRIGFGIWLDNCHTWGIGADMFNVGEISTRYENSSDGSPILARPFFNTATGLEDSELVAFPGVVSGRVTVDATSEFQGWGVHFKRLRCADEGCTGGFLCGCPQHFCRRTEGLFGYRGLQLDESVAIQERLTGTAGEQFVISDSFTTRNQFNGFDLGWTQRLVRGYWTLDTGVRLALGTNRQTVTIAGSSVITDPAGTPSTPQTYQGGLLAQRSNIGSYTQDEFAVVPELNAKLGYQLTDNLRLTVGYTFIYWSNVVRPGEHIDTDLNPALLPPESDPFTGVLRPSFAFDTTDYWAQGISVGGEYRW
ncbi:hypothetical protein V7x_29300 [Crateriforma conspicua]|uniref:Uncharacterized protein n=1 Tax=Crateriforma conspicua TaxID=2527996 RepID=A0A5C6FY97_9PLAN|nr:BBP7 family outer membrane beta-barrel protein [Crateriforma conspicua]TWU67356.1 hypothetical protein V7x_29300 [Crateriforma conspicua]